MRQVQAGPSRKSFVGSNDYLPPVNRGSQGYLPVATLNALVMRLLRAIGCPQVKIELWNGQEISSGEKNLSASLLIRDIGALMKLLIDPELYFGELYSAGRIEVRGKLLVFLELVYRTWPYRQGLTVKKLLAPFYNARRHSLPGSRRNIHHHYDIGNDFYKLWLDESMVYTCAYFQNPGLSLEDAQLAKMDLVCRKLRLRPGETVVEAGCGWGSLALYMAKHFGVTVKAYNISGEQVSLARQRARAEGLAGKVEFIEDDYRHMRGDFDAFVSVGMLEHVGIGHYHELGTVINRVLKDNGRGLIHSIGLNFPRPMDAWTERHIFPGASPPSLAQMMRIFEPFDFSVLDVENLRLHYARTLEHWLQRYEANVDFVTEMFDPEFVRAWRLYLAGSLTAFKTGSMQLFQVGFARSGLNMIPWTRQYLYDSRNKLLGKSDGKM